MATFAMLLSMTLLSLHTVLGAVTELSLDPCPTTQNLNVREFLKVQISGDRNCTFDVQHTTAGGRLLFKAVNITLGGANDVFQASGGSQVIDETKRKLRLSDSNQVSVEVTTEANAATSGFLYIYAAGTANVPTGDIIVKPCPATEFFTTSNFPEKFPNNSPGGANFVSFSLTTESGNAEDVEFTFYVSDFRMFDNPVDLDYTITSEGGSVTLPARFPISSTTVNGMALEVRVDYTAVLAENGHGLEFSACYPASGGELGDPCDANDDCSVENAVCGFASSNDCTTNTKTCICPKKYTATAEGTCEDANETGAKPGEECDDSLPCSDSNSNCPAETECNRVCTCSSSHVISGDRCALKIGQRCTCNSDCVENSKCKGRGNKRTCKCLRPFTQQGEECVRKVSGRGSSSSGNNRSKRRGAKGRGRGRRNIGRGRKYLGKWW